MNRKEQHISYIKENGIGEFLCIYKSENNVETVLCTCDNKDIAKEMKRLWNSEPQEGECGIITGYPEGFPKSLLNCCCCICQYHKEVQSHPWTDGYSCSHVKGYVCTVASEVYNEGNVTDCHKHGICELFTQRGEK